MWPVQGLHGRDLLSAGPCSSWLGTVALDPCDLTRLASAAASRRRSGEPTAGQLGQRGLSGLATTATAANRELKNPSGRGADGSPSHVNPEGPSPANSGFFCFGRFGLRATSSETSPGLQGPMNDEGDRGADRRRPPRQARSPAFRPRSVSTSGPEPEAAPAAADGLRLEASPMEPVPATTPITSGLERALHPDAQCTWGATAPLRDPACHRLGAVREPGRCRAVGAQGTRAAVGQAPDPRRARPDPDPGHAHHRTLARCAWIRIYEPIARRDSR